jgi:hypothetical protein
MRRTSSGVQFKSDIMSITELVLWYLLLTYICSGLLSIEFFQFEVFAVVCVGLKWCYNIPISVGLNL